MGLSSDSLADEDFSSFLDTPFDPYLPAANRKMFYDSLISETMDIIGIPNSDISIFPTANFGAYAALNKNTNARKFYYNVQFFDSVFKVTGSLNCIRSVCFHELGHHAYRHQLKPSSASHLYEKQADTYSGHFMRLIGASLEQTIAVIKHFAPEISRQGSSHPDKAARIAAIERGYYNAGRFIQNRPALIAKMDTKAVREYALLDQYMALTDTTEVFVSFMETREEFLAFDNPTKEIRELKQDAVEENKGVTLITVFDELYSIDQAGKIFSYTSNEQCGELKSIPGTTNSAVTLYDQEFQLEKKNIYMTYPDMTKIEVGIKIN